MSIHQILCTHGSQDGLTSELEQREIGEEVVTHSGSLDENQLRQCLQSVHSIVNLRRQSHSKGRLFFLPRIGDLQVVGVSHLRSGADESAGWTTLTHLVVRDPDRSVSPPSQPAISSTRVEGAANGNWRTEDAVQSHGPMTSPEGSAAVGVEVEEMPQHVASSAPKEAAIEKEWSLVDCLRLWGAPGWRSPDAVGTDAPMASIPSLADLLDGTEPVIDDRVFLSFLTQPSQAAEFQDTRGVVPERWCAMEPEQRRGWFAEAFGLLLRNRIEGNRPVVLVAEPEAAALIFYGIGRLLPEGPLRSEIGFSTFEPVPEQACIPLVGTWPVDPMSESDSQRWPGAAANTLGELPSTPASSQFVSCMVRQLLDKGWAGVDRLLEAMATVKVADADQLELLAAVERGVDSVLEHGSFPNESWRNSPPAMAYLRETFARRVADMENPAEGLKSIVAGSAHLVAIDLLSAKPPAANTRKAVIHLLSELPAEKSIGLLKLPSVPDDDKITALGRFVHNNGNLPPGCEFLWDEFSSNGDGPRKPGAVLMARVIAKLPSKDLKKLYRNVPRDSILGFVAGVFKMHDQKRLRTESLSSLVQAMEESAVYQWLRTNGPEFLRSYPKEETAMGERLAELLHTLPKHPQEFKPRLELILAGQHLLQDEQHQEAAAAWDTCAQLIPKIAGLQKADTATNATMRMTLLVSSCRDLAKAADQAMSLEEVSQHMTWNQKRDALLRIAQESLGGVPLLLKGPWEHEVLLERITTQFHHHRWPNEPLKKDASPKKETPRKAARGKSLATVSWGLVMMVLLGMVLLMGVIGGVIYFSFFSGGPRDERQEKTRRPPKRERQSASITLPTPLRIGDFVGDRIS